MSQNFRTMRTLVSLAILCSSLTRYATAITPTPAASTSFALSQTDGRYTLKDTNEAHWLSLRGGASDGSTKKGKKKKSKGKGKTKKAIDDAMKEKDAAEAMGDAIRWVYSLAT